MIKNLSHTTIYVLDQAKAIDFYANKLGLEIRTDMPLGDDNRWITVGPRDQPELEIVLYKLQPGGRLDEEAVGYLRALLEKEVLGAGVWATNDCHAAYADLKAKGVEFISPPQEQFYGIEAIFKDGCGNWFSLTQHVPAA